MFVVAVTLTLAPGTAERFMPLVLENARASEADEPGCHRFDVCVSANDPNTVFLYELYEDAAAFDTHRTMPHYERFDAAVRGMLTGKKVRTYDLVDKAEG